MVKVDDNAENMEICKKFCGTCPTFKDNQLKEAPPHALFCARGKSAKASTAKMTGCNCPGCGVYTKYTLTGGYFCTK
jgi:hypothetical protein